MPRPGCDRSPSTFGRGSDGLRFWRHAGRDERVGLYSCSCDAVIDDFGCGSRSQHLRPWWLHRNDRLGWRWPS
jgi:hypothetical protein